MYYNLGNYVIDDEDIIGIFDLDITSQSLRTREFLSKAEKGGSVINTAQDIPKSYVVTTENVYLTQQNTAVLIKRQIAP